MQELLDFFVKNAYKARNVDRRVREGGRAVLNRAIDKGELAQ